MAKITVIIAVILSIILLPAFCYCQDDFHEPDLEQKTVEGRICSIDMSYSNIVIKMSDYHDEITINVPSKAVIYKNGSAVTFNDLAVDDNVVVDYYNDSPNPLKALKIVATS